MEFKQRHGRELYDVAGAQSLIKKLTIWLENNDRHFVSLQKYYVVQFSYLRNIPIYENLNARSFHRQISKPLKAIASR